MADGSPFQRRSGDAGPAPQAGRPHRAVAGGVMIRLDALREMIIEARCSEAAARPFPSGWCTTYLAAGLARAEARLLHAGAQQKRLMLPEFRLAGTPDGLIEWQDQSETVLEVKSHGTAQNYDSGPSEMHVRQAELNIELFHEVTTHRPEDAIIICGLTEDYERLTL